MNPGLQIISSTPYFAPTKTDPFGNKKTRKQEFSKDLTKIMVAHNIPYVAQTSISHYNDLIEKSKKAFSIKGPKFINSLSPCIPGWGIKENDSLKVARLAVETCFWPLYEVVNGKYKITYDPGEKKKPIEEFLKTQKRFAHLLNDKEAIKKIQERIDKNWEDLKKLEKCDF
jgi:pyruvate ferredoxin oxidoreductase beta subunit